MLLGDDDMPRFGDVVMGDYMMDFNWQDEILPDGNRMGEKCVRYRFTIDPELEIAPPLTITFEQMFATPREGMSPCEELMNRFKTNPRAKEAGLKIRCEDVPNARDDFTISVDDATPVLEKFDPFVVTEDQALALVEKIHSAGIDGPWEFTIESLNVEGSLP